MLNNHSHDNFHPGSKTRPLVLPRSVTHRLGNSLGVSCRSNPFHNNAFVPQRSLLPLFWLVLQHSLMKVQNNCFRTVTLTLLLWTFLGVWDEGGGAESIRGL